MTNKKQIFTTVLSVLISVFLVAGVVYAVTTISTSIVTEGALTVAGVTALNGGLTMDTNKFVVADVTGNTAIAGTVTVGSDGIGKDVTFYSDTAGAYAQWDASESRLYLKAVDKAGANLSPLHAEATIDGATGYYYGLQSDIIKSGTAGIDDCTAVTAYIEQQAGNFTLTGRFAPLQAILSGSGTVGTITKTGSGAVYAAWIANRGTQTNTDAVVGIHNQSAATAISGILFDLNGTVTNAIKLTGTVTYGLEFNGATIGTADIRLQNGETISNATDGTIALTVAADGSVNVLTGNLKVGSGTPGLTLNGEDTYITGTLEVDGSVQFDGTIAANNDVTIAAAKTLAVTTADKLTVGGIIVPQYLVVTYNIPAGAAAADYDGLFFTANRAYEIVSVTERHAVAGSDTGAVTLMVKKVPSGTATASGTDTLASGLDLKSAVDTNQAGTLHATQANYQLASGDSLGLVPTGTPTAVDGVTVTVVLKAI